MPAQSHPAEAEASATGVSYIMPILNEAAHIERAVTSILAQDYDGRKEVVLALGPSTDGTNEIVSDLQVREPRLHTVDNPTGDTPTGLNLAIGLSQYSIVIRVDAHCELGPDYTRRGVQILTRTGAANVGGLMDAVGETHFQRAVARAYISPAGLGGAVYHSGAEEGPAESAYLGIFRRKALEEMGGFDETLRRGQDWDLNLRLRKAGHTVWFDPTLKVTYWPRGSWRKLVHQFHATGIWRGELFRRHSGHNSLRYLAPPLLVLGIAAGLLSAMLKTLGATNGLPRWGGRALTATAWAPAAYPLWLGSVLISTEAGLPWRDRWYLMVVLPSMHLSWGLGFISGLLHGAGDRADKSR